MRFWQGKRVERSYSSCVTVGIMMVWQSQFKSVSPRGIVSEIGWQVHFGLEEENRRYTVTTNNTISGSVRKKKKCVCRIFGGCWAVVEKMPSQVFICSGNSLTNTAASLQYFLNSWKLMVSFWSGATYIIFRSVNQKLVTKMWST